jgi:hypothetical protein
LARRTVALPLALCEVDLIAVCVLTSLRMSFETSLASKPFMGWVVYVPACSGHKHDRLGIPRLSQMEAVYYGGTTGYWLSCFLNIDLCSAIVLLSHFDSRQ